MRTNRGSKTMRKNLPKNSGFLLVVIASACLLMIGCGQQGTDQAAQDTAPSANKEKVSALDSAIQSVAATGRVEIVPEKSFSPVRGVVCEKTGVDQGSDTGICYDVNGPSVAYTRIYLSDLAAAKLNTEIKAGMTINPEKFTTAMGLVCLPLKQQCQAAEGSALNDENIVRYNTALYAFPAPPAPPIMAPLPPKPPVPPASDS